PRLRATKSTRQVARLQPRDPICNFEDEMKKSIVLSTIAFFSVCAQAQGIPVIDASNLAQALEQVSAWQKQYQQMTQQIEQLTKQVDALTSSHSYNQLANNSLIKQYLPKEFSDVNTLLKGGSLSTNQSDIASIRSAYGVDVTSNPNAMQNEANALANAVGKQKSLDAQASSIETLQNQIPALEDLKASSDLVNRNLNEVQTLLIQMLKRQDMAEATAAADKLREAAEKQARTKSWISKNKLPAID
ncbi:hypothetical protein KIK84_16320, partial [Curvibacter sp. CHRR-16]|uniref:type IV secretion system protein n=1 Tax=Curvibacter sp. CHRR-16 TaxID=2835872 RepID=UPI001BD9B082